MSFPISYVRVPWIPGRGYGTGGGLQGYLPEVVTRQAITAVFGQPDCGSEDGKVSVQWCVRFGGEVIATIYDWKGGDRWHIGGKGALAVELIGRVLGVVAERAR